MVDNVRQIYENADDYYEREHETLEALVADLFRFQEASDWKELIKTIYQDGEYSGYIRGAMERL